ncbi:SNF2 family N-terminal domain-containing protein [Thamnocephalis sphaerospora]|uniref:SNF2 family N-terminal domain-containing protein n=1 Tax=Thamnocephalis sphaerospora TaxID=78915 RepID=A0A4P9XSE0_9FUNG|nr:SNF2 family N-terminal domain-containing protein [Thamnocephalis sphaerospora]|eukprot:RKP08892.1 SNF2 family N-terminal domain-containing protein [Thamnocephalis sphaerospora]
MNSSADDDDDDNGGNDNDGNDKKVAASASLASPNKAQDWRNASSKQESKPVDEVLTDRHQAEQTTGGDNAPSPLNTALSTVGTPFLLRHKLRDYQLEGLRWMVDLHDKGLNGILADEMGLGKTIQTIALFAHLACEKGVWGPHLVVVPTSVLLNWTVELKKWCPGLKVLTYYGSAKERKERRRGWSTENSFHVCVTTYQLVLQDQAIFRRRHWYYMVLDEAHNIKNFRSQRWQTLLGFHSRHRLLLTGTPLQNNLTELWSLLYFLMPGGIAPSAQFGFASQREFQEWFGRPIDRIIQESGLDDEGVDRSQRVATVVQQLHTLLRPYLLRRIKADVEQQLPGKYEHTVWCRLSKRQRLLYDDFMARARTRETLASGHYLSIINCLMQLRKVCNHPDLFEPRPVVTSFSMPDVTLERGEALEQRVRRHLPSARWPQPDPCSLVNYHLHRAERQRLEHAQRWQRLDEQNVRHYERSPVYGGPLLHLLTQPTRGRRSTPAKVEHGTVRVESLLEQFSARLARDMAQSLHDRVENSRELLDRFAIVIPPIVVQPDRALAGVSALLSNNDTPEANSARSTLADPLHPVRARQRIGFPDKRLLQYDCGKLQTLDRLLRDLKAGGHRTLIFTQMTRMLDILEAFLNLHGHRYLRLDGATKVEQRQSMTERFNADSRIFAFILSTRSGGLGINLTGADSVIFYDSDWNPFMDRQCQDRCHRIGQTRDVHIYRLVSEHTIEDNILRKASQKRMLDNVVIQKGDFTTEFLARINWRDALALAEVEDAADVAAMRRARREAMETDRADLVDYGTSEQTQKHDDSRDSVCSPTPTDAPAEAIATADDDGEEDEDEDGPGAIEEYMLRMAEWNYAPSSDA